MALLGGFPCVFSSVSLSRDAAGPIQRCLQFSFSSFLLPPAVCRPHTLNSTSTSKSFQSTVTGELNAPYSKQFVHSKSSQYRKMKTEWKSNVYLARSRIQVRQDSRGADSRGRGVAVAAGPESDSGKHVRPWP